MIQGSRRVATTLAATAVGLLAACATPATPPDSSAAAPVQATPGSGESGTIVGSRIPRKSTERMVRQTGAAGAAEMERDRPPNPGPKVN